MTRGPAPKPTELKILAGNPGRRPLNTKEPKPQNIAPRMPPGLDYYAKKFWKDIIPKLEKLNLATEVDGQALEMMALHYSLSRRAYLALVAEGFDSASKSKSLITHSKEFHRWAMEFGLTPSARTRLKVSEPEDDNQDDLFGY